jgi:hypothetical protein
MSDAPLDRLARNVKAILAEAGLAKASSHSPQQTAGFRVFVVGREVEVVFATSDFMEPSYVVDAEHPRHRDHPLLMFRRTVESTMLTTYVAVLHAAGFTVTLCPADEDGNDHLLVTAGPLEGLDPIQEIKDLHNRAGHRP